MWNRPNGWNIERTNEWMNDWFIDWLIDVLIDWLIDWKCSVKLHWPFLKSLRKSNSLLRTFAYSVYGSFVRCCSRHFVTFEYTEHRSFLPSIDQQTVRRNRSDRSLVGVHSQTCVISSSSCWASHANYREWKLHDRSAGHNVQHSHRRCVKFCRLSGLSK